MKGWQEIRNCRLRLLSNLIVVNAQVPGIKANFEKIKAEMEKARMDDEDDDDAFVDESFDDEDF